MVQPVPLHFGRDNQGFNAYAPNPPTVSWQVTLNNNQSTAITVPNTAPLWIVSFRYYPNDVWVNVSGVSATLPPAGGNLSATTTMLNPASLTLVAGTTISIITNQAAADVGISMWSMGL